MNMELSRTYITRIGLVGLVIGGINHVLVRPQANAAQEAQFEYQTQSEIVEQGEASITQYQDDVDEMVEVIRNARNEMLSDLTTDVKIKDQQLLQRKAALHGLTVTRVEPMRGTKASSDKDKPEEFVELEIKEFRIECRGSYSGFVAFIDDLQDENRRMKVISFRMVPTDEQIVRASMTVKFVELLNYPESLDTAFVSKSASDDSSQTEGDEG